LIRARTHVVHGISAVLSANTARGSTVSLISLLVVLIIVGFALWLINRFIPMASSIKSILNAVVVLLVVVWLLKGFGLWNSIVHTLNVHVG
jgi:uncharacterized membrane-anchored protein